MSEPPPHTRGFATRRRRAAHFQDHGAEVGAADEKAYERMADDFLGGPTGPTVAECLREFDGARIRYNRATEEFGILASDGYIRTYFKPNPRWHGFPTNLAYFRYECRRTR
jgi:pyocin large subunit-like protein